MVLSLTHYNRLINKLNNINKYSIVTAGGSYIQIRPYQTVSSSDVQEQVQFYCKRWCCQINGLPNVKAEK